MHCHRCRVRPLRSQIAAPAYSHMGRLPRVAGMSWHRRQKVEAPQRCSRRHRTCIFANAHVGCEEISQAAARRANED